MKKLVIILTAWVIFVAACNSSENGNISTIDSSVSETGKGSAVVQNETPGSGKIESVLGIYKGVLPCADCEGIDQMILLSPDQRFRMSETYLGKNPNPFMTEGKWETVGDSTIQVLIKDSIVGMYKVGKDQLIHLGQSGVPITGPLASNYILRKSNPSETNSAWKKKKESGIDFLGIGTEPFWSLNIDNEKQVSFQMADWAKPVNFEYSKPVVSGYSQVYELKDGSSSIKITIDRTYCSDGMSDNWYEYAVKVEHGGMVYKGCGVHLQ